VTPECVCRKVMSVEALAENWYCLSAGHAGPKFFSEQKLRLVSGVVVPAWTSGLSKMLL